jgi:hypothetical protein
MHFLLRKAPPRPSLVVLPAVEVVGTIRLRRTLPSEGGLAARERCSEAQDRKNRGPDPPERDPPQTRQAPFARVGPESATL